MRWPAVLGWGFGIWLAAGVETAGGQGMPGPLLIVALAAGLWSGTTAGIVVGFCIGLCEAAWCGQHLFLLTAAGMVCGAAASAVPRWFSHRHLLVALLTAFCFSCLLSLPWLAWSSQGLGTLLRRGTRNARVVIVSRPPESVT